MTQEARKGRGCKRNHILSNVPLLKNYSQSVIIIYKKKALLGVAQIIEYACFRNVAFVIFKYNCLFKSYSLRDIYLFPRNEVHDIIFLNV